MLAEPPPPTQLKLDLAVWLYARAIAHANSGALDGAREDRAKLAALASSDWAKYETIGVPARLMSELALGLADGEIARRSGHIDDAVARLQNAAAVEKRLPYTEPPFWHQPVSHMLGAALLEAHRPGEAEGVYRESLKSYRRDGWALFGLSQALDAQGKTTGAAAARSQFRSAWKLADVTLRASRF